MYNHIGIINCGRENFEQGFPPLAKAEQIYKIGLTMDYHSQGLTQVNNIMHLFMRGCSADTLNEHAEDKFRFFIDGGFDKVKLE